MSYKVKRLLGKVLTKLARHHWFSFIPPNIESSEMAGACPCCGNVELEQVNILGDELVERWQLLPHEICYINRQQGFRCKSCGSRLRSMALAAWFQRYVKSVDVLQKLVNNNQLARSLSILEINEAGQLTQFLKKLPLHTLGVYPEIDIQRMTYLDNSFDIVMHSDTLEHIPDPIKALSECYRVLRPGGVCVFTVPVVVDCLSRSTEGRKPTYHGYAGSTEESFRVHTEFGSDVWKLVVAAGFSEYRLFSFEYPAALVHIGVK
jgi:SAM-dependent methyltransferase